MKKATELSRAGWLRVSELESRTTLPFRIHTRCVRAPDEAGYVDVYEDGSVGKERER